MSEIKLLQYISAVLLINLISFSTINMGNIQVYQDFSGTKIRNAVHHKSVHLLEYISDCSN